MNWIELTETHLLTQLSGVELDLIKDTLLGDGQDDPVPDTVSNSVNECRGYVATAGIDLGAEGTIPDRLIVHVVARSVAILMDRVPTLIDTLDPSESRRRRSSEALTILRDVAAKRFSIADPVTDEESSEEAAKPIYRPARRRTTTREQQDGI